MAPLGQIDNGSRGGDIAAGLQRERQIVVALLHLLGRAVMPGPASGVTSRAVSS